MMGSTILSEVNDFLHRANPNLPWSSFILSSTISLYVIRTSLLFAGEGLHGLLGHNYSMSGHDLCI